MVSVKTTVEELAAILEKSYEDSATNLIDSRQLAQNALKQAQGIQATHALIILAVCDFNTAAYQAAFESLLEIVSRYGKVEDKWLGRAYYYLGMSYHQFNLYAEASQYHQKQYELAEKLGDTEMMASALRRIGADHDHMGQPQVALEYYERSIALYTLTNEIYGMAASNYNSSIAYHFLKQPEKALVFIEKAMPQYEASGIPKGLARIHGQAAVILAELGQPERAIHHMEKSLHYAHKSKLNETLALAYIRQGAVYRLLKRYDESVATLQKALEITEATQDVHFGMDVHQELSKVYKLQGEFEKAFYHQEQYHDLYVMQMERATSSRFESLSIVHRTQQAQAEAERLRQLREQDRHYFEKLNQVKDELMSAASHDLKNPLANIMTVLYVLKKHGRLDDTRGKDLLGRIENSARQMRELITNLLDLARLETGKSLMFQEHDIVAFAWEIAHEYQLIAENQGIKLIFESAIENQILSFDSLLLRQVFANLLSNALKFTPKEGVVKLSIVLKENSLRISIEDTGIGIPAKDLPHIFERFYRVDKESHRKTEGTGLGLPICKAIVEQHGGSISVESVEGKGSSFWFNLPIQ